MKTVMVFGTFDILHVGHLDFFKQARKLGDYLLVVVARDVYEVIRTYKPDVIALGYDQKEFTDTLKDKMKEFKLSTNVVRLKPYHAENKKSGKIKSILLKSL